MNINRTCLVSKLVSGKNSTAKKCFRTEPDEMTSSGWIFLSGKESRKYINNPYNFKIKKLSHVLASNPDLELFWMRR